MSREVSAVIALALGHPVAERQIAWSRTFQIARWERCAALAWLRSAATIRAHAPEPVVAAWRAEALAAVALAEMWSAVITRTVQLLESAGVHPIVMKGLPLSKRLYGDISARPCSDLDLYVAAREREAAERALLSAQWTLRAGIAPRESCYVTESADGSIMLEVHSRLLDDALVSHLPFAAPQGTHVSLGDTMVVAHDDEQLPAFLATHLAKHSLPPLLWFVDFQALWNSLTKADRDRAWAAARSARAERYLRWAVARADKVVAAGDENGRALSAVGVRGRARRDSHNALRVAALAATPGDSLRTIAAWAFPPALRGRLPELLELFARRVAAPVKRVRGGRRSYTERGTNSPRSSRALALGAGDFNTLATDALERGAGFWLRATGGSMRPAIRPGTFVYLIPLPERGPALGDVVLASGPGTGHTLHRVKAIHGDQITLRGDANLNDDVPVGRTEIMAIADVVLIRGIPKQIPHPPFLRARARGRVFLERLYDRMARWNSGLPRARTRPTNVG